MKKRVISIALISMLLLLSLTGCTKKVAITTENFKSIAQSHNYTIKDVKSQYSEYTYISEATVAGINNQWRVEFYVLTTETDAKAMFETNRKSFENSKGSVSTEKSINLGNHSLYSVTSNGFYMYLSRIDNTLVYAKVSETYKHTVKDFINELKY